MKGVKTMLKRKRAKKRKQKTIDNYNIDTLTELYFPGINKEIQNRRKVEKFFNTYITEV